jgi:hypothetical protein
MLHDFDESSSASRIQLHAYKHILQGLRSALLTVTPANPGAHAPIAGVDF